MAYTCCSDIIDCRVSDKVYVYRKKIVDANGNINKNMVGIVVRIDQEMDEDWTGTDYLNYKVEILMRNGETIYISDDKTRPFFRKYEFITLKDLKEKHNIEIV